MDKRRIKFLLAFAFFVLSNIAAISQVLHHQMFVAQGNKVYTSSGLIVSQSIGQHSVAGNYSSKTMTVQQGFQQFLLSNIVGVIPASKGITIIAYPNPVVSDVTVEFSEEIKGFVDYKLNSMSGQLLLQNRKMVDQNRLTVGSLGYLPRGIYILSLSASNYKYSVTIIKN